MFVSYTDRRLITRLRREQAWLNAPNWERIIKLADPGVIGLVVRCSHSHLPIPTVGYAIRDPNSSVIAELELAWPERRVGIAIDLSDASKAESVGWTIWAPIEALDDFETFLSSVRT